MRSHRSISNTSEVGQREWSNAAQLIAASVPWIAIVEKPNVRIAQTLSGDVSYTGTQSTPTLFVRLHDFSLSIIVIWKSAEAQRINYSGNPRRCRFVITRVIFVEKQRQETIRLVAFLNQIPVQLVMGIRINHPA